MCKASLCDWAGWFEPYIVFNRDMIHIRDCLVLVHMYKDTTCIKYTCGILLYFILAKYDW